MTKSIKKNSSTKENAKKVWNVAINRMGKLAEQRHFSALRDGFALLVPLVIAASVGVIFMTFIFGWANAVQTSILGWIALSIPGQTTVSNGIIIFTPGTISKQISDIGVFTFYTIFKGVFSFLSIFLTISLSYSFARSKNAKDPFIASLVGLAAFMVLTFGDSSLFGTTGFFVAIIASFISMEIYLKLEKTPRLTISMPAGVPPAVSRSFARVLPAIITLLAMVAIQAPFVIARPLLTNFNVTDTFGIGHAISLAIQAPFIGLFSTSSGSLSIGLVYTFLVAFLWFFGIHGSNVVAAISQPITASLILVNLEYRNTGSGPLSAFGGGSLDAFVFMGGAGVTLAFVIVSLIFSKSKVEREVIKFGTGASIFNINEPILFGIPMVFNFKYFIPFVLSQPILYFITWLAIEVLKIVPPVVIAIPFTTPAGLGGFLASGWQGILLALFNLTIATFIYLPFVFLSNKSMKRKGEELVEIHYKEGFSKFWKKISRKKDKI